MVRIKKQLVINKNIKPWIGPLSATRHCGEATYIQKIWGLLVA